MCSCPFGRRSEIYGEMWLGNLASRWNSLAIARGSPMFCRNRKQAGGLRHIACILIAGLPCLAQTAPLGEAVRSGDLARVRALLNQHVDVNAPESDGSTALDWAVETDNAELA